VTGKKMRASVKKRLCLFMADSQRTGAKILTLEKPMAISKRNHAIKLKWNKNNKASGYKNRNMCQWENQDLKTRCQAEK
jgi:hypothetical protein